MGPEPREGRSHASVSLRMVCGARGSAPVGVRGCGRERPGRSCGGWRRVWPSGCLSMDWCFLTFVSFIVTESLSPTRQLCPGDCLRLQMRTRRPSVRPLCRDAVSHWPRMWRTQGHLGRGLTVLAHRAMALPGELLWPCDEDAKER